MTLGRYLRAKLRQHRRVLIALAAIYSLPSWLKLLRRRSVHCSIGGAFLRELTVHNSGRRNTLKIGHGSRLSNCSITLLGSSCSISIGADCILRNLDLWIEDDSGAVEIGARTTVEGGHIAVTEGGKIVIGADCMFSSDIEIRNGDSHSIYEVGSDLRINPACDIDIGDHVWLGAHCRVMKGAAVGTGSIVGAGSIVTKTFADNLLIAGVPARMLRTGVRWTRQRG